MNYRHHYHAGNFADLVKHAALLALIGRMTGAGPPLTVIDTHAGAGAYDLGGDMARKSGEAARGVARLMAESSVPTVLASLKAAVARANPGGGVHVYPGSPLLAARALRPADRLIAFELRPDDARTLAQGLKPFANTEAVQGDGFAAGPARVSPRVFSSEADPRSREENAAKQKLRAFRRSGGIGKRSKGATLVVIDPPFELADDYARIAQALVAILAGDPATVILVWTPLKDLETFDRLLRSLEVADVPPTLVAEARMRPLSDPLRLNGCALLVVNPPQGLDADLRDACEWVVEALGDPGGEARLWFL